MTMPRNPLTLPVAILRDRGCSVTYVIGHDPAIGCWIYSITPPAGYSLHSLNDGLSDPAVRRDGVTSVVARDGERLIVSVSAYVPGEPIPGRATREEAARRLAVVLHNLTRKIGA